MSNDKPIAYYEGDTAVVRASYAGGCIRALVASFMGFSPLPPTDRFEEIFSEGHLHEPDILKRLEGQGWEIQPIDPTTNDQWEIEVWISEKIVIRGHLDAKAKGPGGLRVAEAKALSKDSYDKWLRKTFEAFAKYGTQITIYMYATGLKAVYAVKDRNSGKMDVRLINEYPDSMNVIKARLAKAVVCARNGELPDCDRSDFPCPFAYLHDERDEDVPVDEEIQALAAAYREGIALEKQAQAIKDESKKRIDERMGDKDKVESTDYRVIRVSVPRKSIDTEKLAAERGQEFVDQYIKMTISNQLRVTEKKKKGSRHDQNSSGTNSPDSGTAGDSR